ncbi:cell wall-binding repeat-containing protein [Kineococcus sp. SYSU DK005]|uniref:cell wall-binding repeat-containing protein n=1 Tax=Kineococcus sp. SYSU DK005 TaxID=3383126 RepID=UPI003D7EB143
MRLAPRPLALAAALAAAVVGAAAAPAGAAPGDVELKATVSRVAGADRVATAIAAAASFSGQQADAVVLTRSDTYADALAGAPLASDKAGPLLMTSRTALQPEVSTAIRDVLRPGGTVYLLGSTSALSAEVESAVRALGFPVQRVQGADRFGTAVEIAKLLPQASAVSVVTGWNYPDGLSAGALMGVVNEVTNHSVGAVLLTEGNTLGAATAGYLAGRSFNTKIAIGGLASVAVEGQPGWARLAGGDRYETSALIAQQFTSTGFFEDATTTVGVATGENWPDALAGAGLLAYGGGPMVLTRPGDLPAASREALTSLQADARAQGTEVDEVLVFGDERAVSAGVAGAVGDALR